MSSAAIEHLLSQGYRALVRQAWADAEAHARRSAELDPQNADAHYLLGAALSGAGECHEAAAALDRACTLRQDPSWLCDLGSVLVVCRRWADAETAFRRSAALARAPRALAGLGHVLCQMLRHEEALPPLRDALREFPSDLLALLSLGWAHAGLENFGAAKEALLAALDIDPSCRRAHALLAEAYRWQRDNAKALDHAERAAAGPALDARALMVLAACRLDCGDVKGALKARDDAWSHGFTDPDLHSHALFQSLYDPREDGASLLRKHRQWNQHHGLSGSSSCFGNPREPNRPLRIGMVAAALRTTPGRFFRIPLLRALSRAGVEVYLYNTQPENAPDDREWFDFPIVRREASLLSVAELADQIRADRIDVLLDGIGHHNKGRIATFALRAAPVQLNYASYPGTTGTNVYDGFFTDDVCTPPGCEPEYSEPLLRLPGGRFLYSPPDCAPEVAPLPAAENGCTTFGIFQRLSKLNNECLGAMARIIGCSQSARVLLHNMDADLDDRRSPACLRLLAFFASRGIQPERITFAGARPLREHLALLSTADVALDTFPYNGQTTTCETLWMGVPLITVSGRTHAGRVGPAILSAANLKGWTTSSVADYVSFGRKVQETAPNLAEVRASMRARLSCSALFDETRHAGEVTAACRTLWRRWCDGVSGQ